MEPLAAPAPSTVRASLGWGRREGRIGGVATSFAFLLVMGWAFTLLDPTAPVWVIPPVLLFAGGAPLAWSRPRAPQLGGSNSPWRGFALAFGLLTLSFGVLFLALLLWGLFFGLTG